MDHLVLRLLAIAGATVLVFWLCHLGQGKARSAGTAAPPGPARACPACAVDVPAGAGACPRCGTPVGRRAA